MIITRAVKEDLQEILLLQYAAFQSEARLCNNPMIPPLTQTLEEVEQDYEKGVILKAVEDGKIIGSIRARQSGGDVYLGKLAVDPEKQNKGLGKKLLQEIERIFPGSCYKLFTCSKSARNLYLYRQLGYRKFKEEKLNEDSSVIFMKKTSDTSGTE